MIGSDYYDEIIRSEKIEIETGIFLVSSSLGWMFSGKKVQVQSISTENNMANDVDDEGVAEVEVQHHANQKITQQPRTMLSQEDACLQYPSPSPDLQQDNLAESGFHVIEGRQTDGRRRRKSNLKTELTDNNNNNNNKRVEHLEDKLLDENKMADIFNEDWNNLDEKNLLEEKNSLNKILVKKEKIMDDLKMCEKERERLNDVLHSTRVDMHKVIESLHGNPGGADDESGDEIICLEREFKAMC